jgi:hypothetical protein
MNATLLLASALLAVPLVTAHTSTLFPYGGNPKDFAEGTTVWYTHDYTAWPLLGPPVDGSGGDGHSEWALGGAHVLVDSGAGVATPYDVPAGSLYCYGEEGHHAPYGPVTVVDAIPGTAFSVAVDTIDGTTPGSGCGDLEEDAILDCIGSCFIPFPPGLDGAYRVYVAPPGTLGHVIW